MTDDHELPTRTDRAAGTEPEPETMRDSRVVRRGGDGLRPWQLAVIVLAHFVLFLFVSGPIWEHPWQPNFAIFASYAPIPIVVVLALVLTRRLTLRTWLLDSLLVGVAKFVVTAGALILLWATHRPPIAHHTRMGASSPTRGRATIRRVSDDSRPARLSLAIDERGFTPRTAALRVGDVIEVRAAGGGLHTVAIERGTTTLFNAPILSDGRPTRLEVLAPVGAVRLRCTVHAEARDEAHVELVVTAR